MSKQESNLPSAQIEGFTVQPQTFDDLWKFVSKICEGDMVPKQFKGKPGEALAAIQLGSEVGLKPMQSLQHICVINGRPAIWGDGGLAIIHASGLLAEFDEDTQTKAAQQGFGRCYMKRKGALKGREYQFTVEEAKTAGLLNKDSYKNYLGDMLVWRARWRTMRALFSDLLKGLAPREEVEDYIEVQASEPAPERQELPTPKAVEQQQHENGEKAPPPPGAFEQYMAEIRKADATERLALEKNSGKRANELKLTKAERQEAIAALIARHRELEVESGEGAGA